MRCAARPGLTQNLYLSGVGHLAELYRLSQTMATDSEAFYLAAQKEIAAPDASAFSGTAPYALMPRLQTLLEESVGLQRHTYEVECAK